MYSFASDEALHWKVDGGDAAMRNVIAKLYWSDVPLQLAAISGWERFSSKTGIYAKSEDESYERLMGLANEWYAVAMYLLVQT